MSSSIHPDPPLKHSIISAEPIVLPFFLLLSSTTTFEQLMSAPRIIAQVVILGSQILGKAFVQAWRQAARNAQASQPAGTQSSGNKAVDALSRTHRMTLDEASQILNVRRAALVGPAKEETELQKMLKNFDHLFAANSPTTKEGKPHSSHYLQSKIIRAKERIEAELFAPSAEGGATAAAGKEAAAKEGATTTGKGTGTGSGKEP